METLVGIGSQTVERQRRILDSRKKDGADSSPCRRHLAYRRVNRSVQPRASTEATSRRARTDRKISSTIQRAGEAIAAGNCDDRKRGQPQSEIASRACVRARARPRRFTGELSAIENNSHRLDAGEIDRR